MKSKTNTVLMTTMHPSLLHSLIVTLLVMARLAQVISTPQPGRLNKLLLGQGCRCVCIGHAMVIFEQQLIQTPGPPGFPEIVQIMPNKNLAKTLARLRII